MDEVLYSKLSVTATRALCQYSATNPIPDTEPTYPPTLLPLGFNGSARSPKATVLAGDTSIISHLAVKVEPCVTAKVEI